jgi:glycosyltransferase involved in cell wall biosynthesis
MPPPWDGLAPHPFEITKSQSKLGHEIDIFCGRWPKAGPLIDIKGVTYHTLIREPLQGTVSITTSVILLFSYIFWRKRNTPDIIHSHGHFAIWIYLYRSILHRFFPWSDELKIPLVVHFHNTAQGRWEAFDKEGKYITPHSKYIQWPLSVFSDKTAVKVASACVFVSEETKNEAIKFYNADPQRCFVVETGVNTELFFPVGQEEREKSRKEMDLDMYDKVILNHGMMVERKNIHLLVDALKFLPINYKLLLVGTMDPSYQQKLNEQIAKGGLKERVTLVGYTPYPLTPIAYQVSDVFVLPSTWEGLPKVVMQGLSAGVPCVVSGFRLSDELDGIIYLDDLNPETIARTIQTTVENRVNVDINKLRLVYSWDTRVKEIENVYDFAFKYRLL